MVDSAQIKNTVAAESDFEGFSSCPEPAVQWQHFYHNVWQEIRDSYINTNDLSNWHKLEHKYDPHLCLISDLDLSLKKITESLNNRWTSYQTKSELSEAERLKAADLLSSGLELKMEGGKYKIEYLHDGSAAQQARLIEGDTVLAVNGKPLADLSLNEAELLTYAKDGSKLQLDMEHNGKLEKVELVIKAEAAETKPQGRLLEDGIAYLRIPDFKGRERPDQVLKELENLFAAQTEKHRKKLQGLVIDLRNNPGGDFPNALKIAGYFLPEGATITKQLLRKRASANMAELNEIVHKVQSELPDKNGKPVEEQLLKDLRSLELKVIVNASSVSAAEVLTAALQDNRRAEIIGNRTFGKGQGYKESIMPGGGRLRVSSMKYLSPAGNEIDGKGLSPNRQIDISKDSASDNQIDEAVKQIKKQRRN